MALPGRNRLLPAHRGGKEIIENMIETARLILHPLRKVDAADVLEYLKKPMAISEAVTARSDGHA
jgi:hypothetical protein